MNKSRLEAFSDGVLAIIITIMVLEIKIPESTEWEAIKEIWTKFACYILSFIYVGIYWNNHHHIYQAVKNGVNGGILWANLNLLFWLSLIPFATGWMGEHQFTKNPVILYGFIFLMCAVAYYIMVSHILKSEGKDSLAAKAIKNDFKGKISIVLYIIGIIFACFVNPYIGVIFYFLVALIWLIPDKRIEKFYK